jgi:hypothetical protein
MIASSVLLNRLMALRAFPGVAHAPYTVLEALSVRGVLAFADGPRVGELYK